MNPLSSEHLLANLKSLVKEERRLTLEVLEHLKEVEARLLHLEMGYPSLHAFAITELGYSEAAAARRIETMRLLKKLPEAKTALEEGKVTLSNLATIGSFVRRSKTDPNELLQSIEGKSTREVERLLVTLAPEHAAQDRERPITEDLTELRITVDQKTLSKLKRVQQELRSKPMSWNELLGWMADLALKKSKPSFTPAPESGRAPSKALRSFCLERDGFQCTYEDKGKRCCAKAGLQIDHVRPVALGGETEASNLRTVCGNHNRLLARQAQLA